MKDKSKPDLVNKTVSWNRRTFFEMLTAVVAGTVAIATPFVVGVVSFLSPLFKKNSNPQVRIALLSQIPDDGMPRSFPVVTDHVDAWTKYPEQRVGSVYLVRNQGAAKPIAFTAKCPHAGCFIGYKPGDELFRCPCHTSAFNLDGTRERGDAEVAPRDMDRLPVELRTVESTDDNGPTEVWIEFIDFQTGHKEAISTV
ncbi:QcrA and Rieske domain-containing protein [Bythopirellula polymerisocia]|uniref:Cytochrome b6-f complex iron-sulfur subunit n=1 Tax=Bythopirellula polymerisocia TaxID=2528003 RepID=A0A5C6CVI9_9BACT|nr:Rieske 2Fe-2S domain-containing protein [Bythopirellula polymerisocia]TWU27845.1 Cytochrome b6-f complex iron-sulfur subunit [Bythopirellula polymerisocia]